MRNFRKRAFPLVPVTVLALYVVIGAVKARTAAVLTPCEEQQLAQPIPIRAEVNISPVASTTFTVKSTLTSISTTTSKLLERAKQRKRCGKFNSSLTGIKTSILTLLSWQYPYLGLDDVSTSLSASRLSQVRRIRLASALVRRDVRAAQNPRAGFRASGGQVRGLNV